MHLVWRAPENVASKPLPGVGQVSGTFNISARRPDVFFMHSSPAPPDAVPVLFEEADYRIFINSKANNTSVSIVNDDPTICASVSAENGGRIAAGTINFRSNVGLCRFTVLVDGEAEFDFEIEVFPTKMDYKSDYDQLLSETRWYLAELVFELLRPTLRFAKPSREQAPDEISWIFVLRSIIEHLENAARFIASHPMRALNSETQLTNIAKVRKIDSSVRNAVRRGAGAGPVLEVNNLQVKQSISSRKSSFTIDTPEHRWIRFQLRAVQVRLQQLIESELTTQSWWEQRGERPEKKSTVTRKDVIIRELKELSGRLQTLKKLEPFDAATNPPPSGFASLQLLCSPGYKECYQCLTLLRYGLQLDFESVQFSVKEISVLYEYWCFLTLLNVIAAETGVSVPASELIKINKSGVSVALRKGEKSQVPFHLPDGRVITATYNKQFEQADDAILIPQKPDMMISIQRAGWPTLSLLLDAKYRVRCDERIMQLYKSPGPDEDAINCLHRYRDAILSFEKLEHAEKPTRQIIQAAAMFPYRDSTGEFSDSRLWRSLETIGIGAIPLLPTEKRFLQRWISAVLQSSEWSLADKAIEHIVVEKREDWRRAASESVLVGLIPRQNFQQRITWFKESGLYYMPLRLHHPRQFSVKQVAIYETNASGGAGAVTTVGEVAEIEIKKRNEILTPWESSPRENADFIVYRVSNIRAMDAPIVNSSGDSMRGERWTSRLALERAASLNELLLETEPEWRLYDTLRNRGLSFKVRAGEIRQLGPDVSSRRAQIVVGDTTIIYLGAGGFAVKGELGERTFPNHELVVDFVCKGKL